MWAQLISMRLEKGAEDEFSGLMDALDAVESEEKARVREDDPRGHVARPALTLGRLRP